MRGIPDLLVCYKGVFMAIECKAQRGTFEKLQLLQHHRMRLAGAVVVVARGPGGVDLVKRILDRLDDFHSVAQLVDSFDLTDSVGE